MTILNYKRNAGPCTNNTKSVEEVHTPILGSNVCRQVIAVSKKSCAAGYTNVKWRLCKQPVLTRHFQSK